MYYITISTFTFFGLVLQVDFTINPSLHLT